VAVSFEIRVRENATMLSRVADSLYWMSRYLERAENTVRQLDVTVSLMLDSGNASPETRWQRFVAALGNPPDLEWSCDLDEMTHRIVFDSSNHASVIYCVNGARENARQIREEISTEQWQRLNRLFHHMHSPDTQLQARVGMSDVLVSILDGIHLFKGVSDTTMIHGQGWQFIRLGRYLERSYSTATLLEVFEPDITQLSRLEQSGLEHSGDEQTRLDQAGQGQSGQELAGPEQARQEQAGQEQSGFRFLEQVGLLRCCTAFEAYCQVYTADIDADRILEFLLLNRDFPHAIRYCVDSTLHAIDSIQRTGGRRPPEELRALIGRLHAQLGFTTVGEILSGDAAAFLHSIRKQCMSIHEQIYRHYIQYSIQSALTA
jgi:uncharacterized alpha-E superfamily protein